MTFSLLARDPDTGKLGGIAATGNLCVGGWVLAGNWRAGMVASQGQAPSTIWRETVLELMASDVGAEEAVARTVAPDQGREFRQLAALDRNGQTGVFTGSENGSFRGHVQGRYCIASGNILAGSVVLEEMVRAFESANLPFEERLLQALIAGERSGGDERGVLSAAMLVLSSDEPPLSLRVDHHETPVTALGALLLKTREPGYLAWLATVPTQEEPQKHAIIEREAKTGTS